jgi:CubicO group peptidase (beta-lactamase class C family)
MSMTRHRWLLFALGIALATTGRAKTPVEHDAGRVAGISAAALESFANTEVRGRLAATKAPGALLVVVDRQGNRYERAFGTVGPNDATPLDTRRHLFRIASETKAITALAILQLADAGRLSLDDDIEKHLGGLRLKPAGGAPITIRHLLQHRGGIGNIPMVGSGLLDSRDHPALAAYLAENAPKRLRPPGLDIGYTNGAYTLLGRIIETASGETYDDYIVSRIFRPLGMRHAGFPGSVAAGTPIAQGLLVAGGKTAIFPAVDTRTRPSGDAMMTAHDMGSFLVMMLNGGRYGGRQVVDDKAITAFQDDCWSADPAMGGRCLGSTRILRAGSPIYLHGGDYITSLSSWYLLPRQGIALWVGSTSNMPIDNSVFEAFLKRFQPALAAPHMPEPVGRAEHDLGGIYRINSQSMSASGLFFELLQPGSEYRVKTDGDAILVDGRRYVRIAADLFQAPGSPRVDGDMARFLRDGDGRIFALHFNAHSAAKIGVTASAHAARFAFGLALALLTILSIAAAIRAIILRRRGMPTRLPAATAASSVLLLAGTCAALSLPMAGPFVMFGLPPLFRVAQGLWVLGGLTASIGCIAFARGAHRIDRAIAIAATITTVIFMFLLFRWDFL